MKGGNLVTISLGMIVKNEGRTLRQCLESVAPHVDEIVIGLGGESTDDTEAIAREFTPNVFQIDWKSDFAAARNEVMGRVTGDYFLWLDGDDTLVGGEKLRSYTDRYPNVSSFYMGYDYGRDEHGQNVCYLIRERLVAMFDELPHRGWKWVGAVHEVLVPEGHIQLPMKIDDILVVHHKPADKHEPERNLVILREELARTEPNPDPRLLVYLGNETSARGQLDEALAHWRRFIKLSGWAEEKYQTQHKIADVLRAQGRLDEALKADLEAVQILPEWPDAYYGLAETSYHLGNAVAAIEWTKIGAAKPRPQTGLILNPLDYSYYPAVILGLAHTAVGDFDLALQMYTQAYAIKPEEQLKSNIVALTSEINLQKVEGAFHQLREYLGRHDEWLKVRKLMDVIPHDIQRSPKVLDAWQRTMQQTAHIERPKIMEEFYTGNPHWTPIPDELIENPNWLEYPRMAYALSVANRIGARHIVDWGCSDGFIALPLARATGARVKGFDLDPRCVDLANSRAANWKVDASFEVGNVDEIGGVDGPKADLALLFEVIEHVIDPAGTLARLERTADHIALTTPYLAWEQGNIEAWDKIEPKGHLRIFDQYDLEKLLAARGQIQNIYREPYGGSGWLFADYKVGVKLKKTVMIFAPGTIEEWNPRTWATGGMGGSETAIIKLTEALADDLHRPIVYTRTPEPGYFNGVGYRPVENFREDVSSDLFIAWRAPEVADVPINTKKLVLWMHDTDAGDRLTKARASRFHAIVVLTEWHKQHMLKTYPFLKPEQLVIIPNGVDAYRFIENDHARRNPKKVIYSSSPDRGLDIILEHIWPKVVAQVPDAELHTYYGWNNFDKFVAVYPHLAAFKSKMMDLLANSKNVVQHGRVPQVKLGKEMMEASIWLYPTYFTETYCITAVEAQLAGVIPVTNRLAALAETVNSGSLIEGDVNDPSVQAAYVEATVKLLKTPPEDLDMARVHIVNNAPFHPWSEVAQLWEKVIDG